MKMSYIQSFCFKLFSCLFLSYSTNALASQPIVGFESSEHISAGENIQLSFSEKEAPKTNFIFTLPNGATISNGEILTLGDFYEIVGKSIADGVTDADRKERFINDFKSFAVNKDVVPELTQILAVINNEKQAIETGMKNGEKPEDIYKKMSSENNRQWNCITGGDCSKNYWIKPGRYVLLAAQDYSHFSDRAWQVYLAGHTAAMEQAIQAHQTNDIKKLEIAYAMNAFACHYLADIFATGHLRTPRYELFKHVTPGVVGSILSSYMHIEDNENPLHVHNARGDHWVAWGDRYYLNKQNSENRKLLQMVLQKSADHIFTAYQTGIAPKEDDVAELVPQADEIGSNTYQDIASLFYWDENKKTLFRRTDISKVHDYHWTANWWGWSTLIILSQRSGIPTEAQGLLVNSEMKDQAVLDGLITDVNVMQYIKSLKK